MAAVVDVCVGELVKLRQRVRVSNFFLIKAQKKDASTTDEQQQLDNQKCPNSSKSGPAKAKEENPLSEDTVCLLMDRFAPY